MCSINRNAKDRYESCIGRLEGMFGDKRWLPREFKVVATTSDQAISWKIVLWFLALNRLPMLGSCGKLHYNV